jgi:hypothetical protein
MARMGDLAGVDDYESDELLAPPVQPRPLNMLGDALYGLGRSLSGAADNPIQPAQDAAYGAFKGMTVDPVVEAYNAVKGRMTEDEQRNMLFGAAIGMLPMGRAAKGAAPAGIKVFHSSPHDFERFDASKIGTGEGAQVYGYGHYFAENPAVSGQGGQYWQQFAQRFVGPEQLATLQFKNAGFDRSAAAQKLAADIAATKAEIELGHFSNGQRMTPSYIADQVNYISKQRQALKLLESGNPVGPRTYEVNLRARPEEFLDWDKPLVQQPIADKVRSLVPEDLRKTFDYNVEKGGVTGANVYNNYVPNQSFVVRPSVTAPYAPTGARTFEEALQIAGGNPSLVRTINNPSREIGSQRLRDAGIPGIRYLDQGSRVGSITGQKISQIEGSLKQARADLAGGGFGDPERLMRKIANLEHELSLHRPTSNYVMFPGTEGLIDITKKYALPTAVLGGLAAQDRYETQ